VTRYARMFEALDARNEGAFGAFLMLGDPDPAASARMLDLVVDAGADMLEVGIPFSDPVADGPVIQRAADRALRAGVGVSDCFDLIEGFRSRHPHVPIGILTYANLVVARGLQRFCRDAASAGVDSLLIADVPTLEAEPFAAAANAAGLDQVMIAAPNTNRQTLARIARLGSGYTYCVARTGVTGAGKQLELEHGSVFAQLKALNAAPPVLGFGISTPEHVRQGLAAGASGVITGSALVDRIHAGHGEEAIAHFVAEMKAATRAGAPGTGQQP
jgi:tryptophan synthase alpha chain